MKNLQIFNELSADIFSLLYESFPIGIDVAIENYADFNTAENSDLFFETIKFYIDEGFIRCAKQVYGTFIGLKLTSKGFSVLNAKPPEMISSQSNIISAIKEATKIGKTELIKNIISETIKFGIKLVSS